MIAYPIYILLFLLSLISTAHGAEIAVLRSQDLPIYQQALDGFQDVYEGEITEYSLQGNPQEAEKIVLSIKKQKPDVVLAIGLLAARAAKEYIEDTPIIFCMVLSPERYSLRGRYITGALLISC